MITGLPFVKVHYGALKFADVDGDSDSDVLILGGTQQSSFNSLLGLYRNNSPCFYTSDTVVSCDPYTWAENGVTYFSDTIAEKVLLDVNGCDSIEALHLTVNQLDISLSYNGGSITSNASGKMYQWLNCDTYSIIPGAVNQTFIPQENGSYAVIISDSNCVDTSYCHNFIGLSETLSGNSIKLYPNPSNGNFNIQFEQAPGNVLLSVSDLSGRSLLEKNVSEQWLRSNQNTVQIPFSGAPGIYMVKVSSHHTVLKTFRLIYR